MQLLIIRDKTEFVIIGIQTAAYGDSHLSVYFPKLEWLSELHSNWHKALRRKENGYEYYVFWADDHAFYKEDGTIKTGVMWTPNRNQVGRMPSLTDDLMSLQKDSWVLIEAVRNNISAHLKNGGRLDYE